MNMLYSLKVWILVVIGILGSILQPDYNVFHDKSKAIDRGTEIQIIWSVFFTQLFAILEAAYIRYPESVTWDLWAIVILIVMLSGLILRTWAILTLGSYFTMHLSIQRNHKVIRNGPYKYFRHPSYVGAFLTYMGTSIFLHAWFSVIVAGIVLPLAWFRRIQYEEKMLIEEFGEEYQSYCKSVKRAIPGIW
jgi:protein-S-isoprenylcysteine O-methyltransferase Ste14